MTDEEQFQHVWQRQADLVMSQTYFSAFCCPVVILKGTYGWKVWNHVSFLWDSRISIVFFLHNKSLSRQKGSSSLRPCHAENTHSVEVWAFCFSWQKEHLICCLREQEKSAEVWQQEKKSEAEHSVFSPVIAATSGTCKFRLNAREGNSENDNPSHKKSADLWMWKYIWKSWEYSQNWLNFEGEATFCHLTNGVLCCYFRSVLETWSCLLGSVTLQSVFSCRIAVLLLLECAMTGQMFECQTHVSAPTDAVCSVLVKSFRWRSITKRTVIYKHCDTF